MDLTAQYTHHFPGQVELGNGTLAKLGEIIKAAGGKKALVSTDPGVLGSGLVDNLKASLDQAGIGYAIFSDVKANPHREERPGRP